MDPVIAALIGGAAVGALITAASNTWRARHDDRRHFVDVKREKYAAFVAGLIAVDDLSNEQSEDAAQRKVIDALFLLAAEIAMLNPKVGFAALTLATLTQDEWFATHHPGI